MTAYQITFAIREVATKKTAAEYLLAAEKYLFCVYELEAAEIRGTEENVNALEDVFDELNSQP